MTYEMCISDWSSDVCSSDLALGLELVLVPHGDLEARGVGQGHSLVGQPGGVLQVGGDGGQEPCRPAGACDRFGTVECRLQVWPTGQHDTAYGLRLGAVLAPVEPERA